MNNLNHKHNIAQHVKADNQSYVYQCDISQNFKVIFDLYQNYLFY